MKTLKEYINESLLDDDILDDETALVEAFLEENYKGDFIISKSKNKDGKYIVDSKGEVIVKVEDISSLTNELFEFGVIKGSFYCSFCNSLKSLEGAPREVGKIFNCSYCKSLTSLEGAPRKVGGSFYCSYCSALKNLKGTPREVGEDFYCQHCSSLKNLQGAPKKVGENFHCKDCGTQFTKEGVKKICNVKKNVYV